MFGKEKLDKGATQPLLQRNNMTGRKTMISLDDQKQKVPKEIRRMTLEVEKGLEKDDKTKLKESIIESESQVDHSNSFVQALKKGKTQVSIKSAISTPVNKTSAKKVKVNTGNDSIAKISKLKHEVQQPPGTKIIDELVHQDQERYQIKRPFMKAQFHQCIPNPKKPGEMVSVQICSMWALGYAEPELSLDEMKDPQNLIQPYTVEGGIQSFKDSKFRKSISMRKIAETQKLTTEQENTQQNTFGKAHDTDPINFTDIPFSTERYDPTGDWFENAPKKRDQIAIISFWKKEGDEEEYQCYHFFYVPNPCVRELGRSDRKTYLNSQAERTTISICQVLFKGQDNDLFMFFNPSQVNDSLRPDKTKWELGVLNIEIDSSESQSKPFPAHHYEDKYGFHTIYPVEDKIVQNVLDDRPGGMCKPNPTLFRRTVTLERNLPQEQTILIVYDGRKSLLRPSKEKTPRQIQMFELNVKQKAKVNQIIAGDVFINYDAETNKISYLENLPEKNCMNECNFVQLELDQNQSKDLVCEKTHLDFEDHENDFYDNKEGMILEAFMHNEGKRITLIKQGLVSITFEKKEEVIDEETNEKIDEKMTILYYIDSAICKGIKVGNDLYVEAQLKSLEKGETLDGRDRTKVKLTIYKVSESYEERYQISKSPQNKLKSGILKLVKQKTKKSNTILPVQSEGYLPSVQNSCEFMISALFYKSLFSEGNYFAKLMPFFIRIGENKDSKQEALKISGSSIFEDKESGEITLSFFRTTDQENIKGAYPQLQIPQSWTIDYPILAYKSVSPDNREIMLVHMAHNIPQRSIHLGQWEFISFVKGDFEDADIRKQIIMLVRHTETKEIKLVMIFIDPWKDINFTEEFDLPENVFEVKHSNISFPKSTEFERMYSPDKIRAVHLLPQTKFKDNQAAIVIQFWHSIYILSNCGRIARRMTQPDKMIPEYIIQGQNNRLFYGEYNLDRSDICMLSLTKKDRKVKKKKIFALECLMIAMESDNTNEMIQQDKSTIFVLGDDYKLLHLQESDEINSKFQRIGVYDFTGYDLSGIHSNAWSHCHIDAGSITFDEYLFQANSTDVRSTEGDGQFYWTEAKHVSQDATVYELDKNVDRIALERVKVEQMPATTSLIAVGREPKRKVFFECGTWFLIRPSHNSREFSVFAEERKARSHDVNWVAFVTNDHVLTQFRKIPEKDDQNRIKGISPADKNKMTGQKTIVFATNGIIVPQSTDVQQVLDWDFVGESELFEGTRNFITSKVDVQNNKRALAILQTLNTGKFELKMKIDDFTQLIKNNLDVFLLENDYFKDQSKLNRKEEHIKNKKDSIEKLITEKETVQNSKLTLRKRQVEKKLKEAEQDLERFQESLINDSKRKKVIKDSLTFSRKLILSEKSIVVLAKMSVPEDEIEDPQNGKNQQDQSVDYRIHIHSFDIDKEWKITLILIQSKADDILTRLQTRLVGDYICYREKNEDKINFQPLPTDTLPGNSDAEEKKSHIDLSLIFKEDDTLRKYVTFDGIKNDSYLRYAELELHRRMNQKMQTDEKYKPRNLLNLTVSNTNYVFDLDATIELQKYEKNKSLSKNYLQNWIQKKWPGQKESHVLEHSHAVQVDYIESIDQLHNLDNFIDTGMCLTSVINNKAQQKNDGVQDWPLIQRIKTNQNVSMFYMRRKLLIQINTVNKKESDKLHIQKQYTREFEGNFYRSYSFMDLLNLVQIRNLLRRKEDIFVRDETMLSVYDGHTFFSIFEYNPEIFDAVYEQLSQHKFQDSVDFNKNPTEAVFLRRLYRVLQKPVAENRLIFADEECTGMAAQWCKKCDGIEKTMENCKDTKIEKCRCQSYLPLLQKSSHYQSHKFRDQLLKIAMLCSEFEASALVLDIDDMRRLFKSYSPLLGKCFEEHYFVQNKSCDSIEQIQIQCDDPLKWSTKAILEHSLTLDEEICEAKIKALKQGGFINSINQLWELLCLKNKTKIVQVEVKAIRADWLFADQGHSNNKNDFLKFIDYLDKTGNENLYITNLVESILKPFWKLRMNVMFYVFFPYIIQSIFCVFYFSLNLQDDQYHFDAWSIIAEVMIVLTSLFFLWLEYVQFADGQGEKSIMKKLSAHFGGEFTNVLQLLSASLNITLVVNEWTGRLIVDSNLKGFTICCIALVWYKAFIWMRLFAKPAFFMNLLRKTIVGILSFTLMLFILVALLSNVIYIADKIDHNPEYTDDIYTKHFGSDLANVLMHTYKLSLGEFDFEAFNARDDNTKVLMWTIWVFATFMLQITFMNMLIAIMGSVYGDVTENRPQSTLREQILLLNDYRVFLDKWDLNLDAQFIFIVKPVQSQLDVSIEDQIVGMKEAIEIQTDSIIEGQTSNYNESNKKFQAISDDMHVMNEDIDGKIESVKEQIGTLRLANESVKKEIGTLQESVDDIKEQTSRILKALEAQNRPPQQPVSRNIEIINSPAKSKQNKSMDMKNEAGIGNEKNEGLKLDLLRSRTQNVRLAQFITPYSNQYHTIQNNQQDQKNSDSDDDGIEQSNENSNQFYSAREDRKSQNSGK